MALTRAQKEQIVSEASETLAAAQSLIIAHNKGLTVAEVSDLRAKMRAAGARYRVVKNTLARHALKGTTFEATSALMKGPTVMATSEDAVAAAKIMVEYAKTNEKIVILGGAYGERALTVNDVEALAKMPSLDELRGKLIGLLQAPAQRIASVLAAPAGQVARVIGAHSRQ